MSTAGGDEVQLVGSRFTPNSRVRFGTLAAGRVTFVSDTELRATTPAGPPGAVDVTVQDDGGNETTLAAGLTYILPPVAQSLAALTGPTQTRARVPIAGNVEVQVTGRDFRNGAEVFVDGVAVPTTFVSGAAVTFTAPPRAADTTADVSVRNPEGLTATLSMTYTQEFSLDPQPDALTTAQAQHLFRRAAFGAPPPVIAQATADGLNLTLQKLMTITPDPNVEAAAMLQYGTVPPGSVRTRENRRWWIHLLLNNPNPLQERMAWFFHDHFATSQATFRELSRYFLHDQIQLFRRSALGNWRDLVVEVSKDKAMLVWLDGIRSTANGPNENFAREVWELFTLGVDNGYTQADIVQASRAFTGFERITVRDAAGAPLYDDVVYRQNRHDAAPKTILGATGSFGYDDNLANDPRDTDGGVIDLTLRQLPVEASTFICRKLAAYFLYPDPHDVVVDELARILRDNNWELQPVLEAILRSKALFSLAARKSQVKDPVSYVVGFLRTAEIDMLPSRVDNVLITLEQVPMQPPDVNGWPTGGAWLGSQAMLIRINFLQQAISQLDDVAGIQHLLPAPARRTPDGMVDHIANGVLGVDLTTNARDQAVLYVHTELQGNTIVDVGFDPNNDPQLLQKTRGLLWQLGQYWDAHQQ